MVAAAYFFFNDTAATEIYPLSLRVALPVGGTAWIEGQLPATPLSSLMPGEGFACD